MTTKECESRDKRIVSSIQSVLRVHDPLSQYAGRLQVTIENTAIVVRGELPSSTLKAQLIPAVRQAGVLSQVCNRVTVAG